MMVRYNNEKYDPENPVLNDTHIGTGGLRCLRLLESA
jgi:hypothetical protein